MISINVFISKPHANFRSSHLAIQPSNFSNMFCKITFEKDFIKSKKQIPKQFLKFSERLIFRTPLRNCRGISVTQILCKSYQFQDKVDVFYCWADSARLIPDLVLTSPMTFHYYFNGSHGIESQQNVENRKAVILRQLWTKLFIEHHFKACRVTK